MKEIYSFEIDREVEKTVEEKKQENGKEVTVTSTVTEKVPVEIVIKKPRRSDYDEAELYYGVQLSEGIKAGLLTRALLAKRFSNDGGVLSENDKDEYSDLYTNLFNIQNDIERITLTKESERASDYQETLNNLLRQQAIAKKDIQEFEMSQAALFDQTAETRARNKTILWWILHLSYVKEGDDYTEYFGNGSVENRLSMYDDYEENGTDFDEEVIRKLIYYVSFWYVRKSTNRTDFEQLLKDLEESSEQIIENNSKPEGGDQEEVKQEETPEEEASEEKAPEEENSSSDSPME